MLTLAQSSMFDTFNDPQMRHAALIHFPIVLAMLGLIPLVIAMFLKVGRRPVVVALVVYLLLIGAAWAGVLSGEEAQGEVGVPPHSVREQIHDHEESAEKIWYFGVAVCVFSLVGLAGKKGVALSGRGLALAAGLAGAGWTAYAAHLGGSLVYDFGVGTPNPVTGADMGDRPREMLADPRAEFFISTVLPILEDRCMGCHTVGDRPDADLDLSTPAGVLAGGVNGPVLVPGDPSASSLFTTVSGDHPEISMPQSSKKLTAEEIEAIRRWIQDGAVWASHEEVFTDSEGEG